MKKALFFLLISMSTFAQNKIEKLLYAKTLISVPEQCIAKSEYEIIDCNGFSAQWIFLSEEMVAHKIPERISKQIEQQFNYKAKKSIKFISQQQPFKGNIYTMNDNTVRILSFGQVNGIPMILNLGFQKEPKSNSDLTEFEKNFINIK